MDGYRGLHQQIVESVGNFIPAPQRFMSAITEAIARMRSRFRRCNYAPQIRLSEIDAISVSESGLYAESRGSIIRLVELLIEDAHASRASDMHIDPRAHALHIRLRIDGFLLDAIELPISVHAELISRIKILANMRIDEHNTAQDGRFKLSLKNGDAIDVRVSVAPTYYGENAVLRLLAGFAEQFSLESLSFTPENHRRITRALKRPHGMILATGPTGSGKTTTLYTLAKILNAPGVSVVTLEDPVEYSIPGTRQIQINPRTGLTFGSGLRSVLRQDPDVIMVGEIRDSESASLAINAALTGHRLLSTLHTGSAVGTIARLLEMGIEPYLVASTLSLSIGQRLVRRICDSCKTEYALSKIEFRSIEQLLVGTESRKAMQSFKGIGCSACKGTGYHGRAGVHEILEITPAIQEAILARKSSNELQAIALAEGMTPIAHDAMRKVAQGITTFEEALKTAYE